MFSIKYGSSRVAVIIGCLVFKFPRVQLWPFRPRRIVLAVINGIITNLSEFYTYIDARATFLAPTISVGVMSVSFFEKGEIPSLEEMINQVWRRLSDRASEYMSNMDCHPIDFHNWRKGAKGYRLIDYGENIQGGGYPLLGFIRKFKKELEALTKA
jgi:hypothetical protein